ncbi:MULTISPECIES: hypothetical protein [unclassified Endozoicomonas]|uniref:hypothetical protein n=1 Tax=unclassified Endozoicomonas TaxID=2644528 RepID=UPI002148B8B3|nr:MULTISPECIES: hypothetical protein [unclassified Endozoicomonas]
MRKTILEIYALLICSVTLICFAVTSGIMLYNLVSVVSPEFGLSSHDYKRLNNNDRYWNNIKPSCGEYSKEGCGEAGKRPPEGELTKKREDARKLALEVEARSSMQTFIKSLIVVIIDILIFIPHWIIGRRARESNG